MANQEKKKNGFVSAMEQFGEVLVKSLKFLSKPVILWIWSAAFLFLFGIYWDIPGLVLIPIIFAVFSRQWLLSILIAFTKGAGIFGLKLFEHQYPVSTLWITLVLVIIFVYGIFTFFFDSKRFLKIKRL